MRRGGGGKGRQIIFSFLTLNSTPSTGNCLGKRKGKERGGRGLLSLKYIPSVRLHCSMTLFQSVSYMEREEKKEKKKKEKGVGLNDIAEQRPLVRMPTKERKKEKERGERGRESRRPLHLRLYRTEDFHI